VARNDMLISIYRYFRISPVDSHPLYLNTLVFADINATSNY